MCYVVLLLIGLIYATRIPKYLKSTPAEFPGCDPAEHARWRAKELGSIYAFLAATWGQTVVFFCLGMALGVMFAGDKEKLESLVVTLSIIEVAVFLGGLIWSAALGSQARAIKVRLGQVAVLPPSYYPRPGQALLQAPPETPPPAPEAYEIPPQGWPPGT